MISQKTWRPGAGPVFLIWLYRKLWKSSSPKLLVQFQNNFTEMIPRWNSTIVVQRIMIICQKTWRQGRNHFFLIHLYYAPFWKKWGILFLHMSVCRSFGIPNGFRSITWERFDPGTSYLVGVLVMTSRWTLLILRSVGQRSRSVWL